MANIHEIRSGASQEPDPNPIGEKAQLRLDAIDQGVAFVHGIAFEVRDTIRSLLYGNFYPDRQLDDDSSLASLLVDRQINLHYPFVQLEEVRKILSKNPQSPSPEE